MVATVGRWCEGSNRCSGICVSPCGLTGLGRGKAVEETGISEMMRDGLEDRRDRWGLSDDTLTEVPCGEPRVQVVVGNCVRHFRRLRESRRFKASRLTLWRQGSSRAVVAAAWCLGSIAKGLSNDDDIARVSENIGHTLLPPMS
jgi:hypothetical protein